ncbi:hypothetical protein RB594_008342 [Gaeumannomyces avenae]
MAGFFKHLKSGAGSSGSSANAAASKKKEEPAPELTPLEKMLQNAGPLREDGSDKFFGLENFGNTCYCNSIVQALYYSETFRENVVNYPPFSPSDTPNGKRGKVNVQIRPPAAANEDQPPAGKKLTAAQALEQRKKINAGQGLPLRPEDKPDSPEYKKKQAMLKGPVLELAQENSTAYGMQESTFTGLKDLFMALIESQTRTGVLSPQRFLEIFKRDNEMFRNSMHQDAHEFYGLVLNDVISNVEANAKKLRELDEARAKDALAQSVEKALGASVSALTRPQLGARSPGTGWVHDIFEGLLTSETKCLTCETASQRDETFLDLSIDLEEHSSVTACLQKFSAEEMLCERNKFHCDHCGGLQEAEKRMKVKRLPKVLALHLKRFKYTEDYSRLQKLFHRVVYPYQLRMFNTTEEAADPDRVYELYAVVVHIGPNALHGHYVSVIKTPGRGWLLFDDEMVEPVDKHFVRNFFGDKPGNTACAYVLFYQETTLEKVMAEQDAEGLEEIKLATQTADLATEQTNGAAVPLTKQVTTPMQPAEEHDALAALDHAITAPNGAIVPPPVVPPSTHPLAAAPPPMPAAVKQSKEEKEREKKEQRAQDKAKKMAEKEQAKLEEKQRKEREQRQKSARKSELDDMRKALQASKQTAAEEGEKQKKENGISSPKDVSNGNGTAGGKLASSAVSGLINRSKTVGGMSRRSFAFLNKDKDRADSGSSEHAASNGTPSSPHAEGPIPGPGRLKERFSFNIGRKKSSNLLP